MKFVKMWIWLAVMFPSPGAADMLAPYQWKSRVVVLAADSASDATLKAQKALLAADPRGWAERDLVILEILGDRRKAARKDLRLSSGFQFVLVGKDGGVKFRSDKPVTLSELYGLVDAMPMRKQEMRE